MLVPRVTGTSRTSYTMAMTRDWLADVEVLGF
jgi:hypothetical protein